MSALTRSIQALIEKIQSLPAERLVEVEDFVDFLRRRAAIHKTAGGKEPLDFPVDDLGPWPRGLSLRREDMYGGDGR